jgi:hypothetical protein
MPTLIVQCSQCNLIMGSKEGQPDENGKNISHSVCPDCLPILYAKDFNTEEMQAFVDKGIKAQQKLKMNIWYKIINLYRKIKFIFQPPTPVEV